MNDFLNMYTTCWSFLAFLPHVYKVNYAHAKTQVFQKEKNRIYREGLVYVPKTYSHPLSTKYVSNLNDKVSNGNFQNQIFSNSQYKVYDLDNLQSISANTNNFS